MPPWQSLWLPSCYTSKPALDHRVWNRTLTKQHSDLSGQGSASVTREQQQSFLNLGFCKSKAGEAEVHCDPVTSSDGGKTSQARAGSKHRGSSLPPNWHH